MTGFPMRKLNSVLILALLAASPLALPRRAAAQALVGISVRIGPPPLRVLAVQPMAPGPGYLWTPGYWAYGPAGYYWVPGAWVMAPQPGLLWTPGYWAHTEDAYVWHRGYWGPRVGYYGGINYGFGYYGAGFAGGHWSGRRFYYNTAVWRVNRAVIHSTYSDRTAVRNERAEGRRSYSRRSARAHRRDAQPRAEARHQQRDGQAKGRHDQKDKKRGDHRGPGGALWLRLE